MRGVNEQVVSDDNEKSRRASSSFVKKLGAQLLLLICDRHKEDQPQAEQIVLGSRPHREDMHAVGFPNCRTVASVVDLGEYPEPLESRLVEEKHRPWIQPAIELELKLMEGRRKEHARLVSLGALEE